MKLKTFLFTLALLPLLAGAAEHLELLKNQLRVSIKPAGDPPVVKWTNGFYIIPRVKDWSKWNTLHIEFKNNSEKEAVFIMRIVSPGKTPEKKMHYFYHLFKLAPSKEWQSFDLPFDTLKVARKPTGFNKIDNWNVSSSGYPNGKDFSVETRNIQLRKMSADEKKNGN